MRKATPRSLNRVPGWNATDSAGFLGSLMGYGLRTDGKVRGHQVKSSQIKSLDWASRRASGVERAPRVAVDVVMACLQSVLE